MQLAVGKEVDLGIENISLLLLHEAGGGLLLGVLLGWVTSRLMREVDDYIISVLVTLSVVMGGYLIARQLHISGPLTMVAAGLFMGNFNVNFKMKSVTQDYLIKFWELIDEILNAVLFLFIGFELLMIKDLQNFIIPNDSHCCGVISQSYFYMGPTQFMSFRSRFSPQTIKVLIWGGIRGEFPLLWQCLFRRMNTVQLFLVLLTLLWCFLLLCRTYYW